MVTFDETNARKRAKHKRRAASCAGSLAAWMLLHACTQASGTSTQVSADTYDEVWVTHKLFVYPIRFLKTKECAPQFAKVRDAIRSYTLTDDEATTALANDITPACIVDEPARVFAQTGITRDLDHFVSTQGTVPLALGASEPNDAVPTVFVAFRLPEMWPRRLRASEDSASETLPISPPTALEEIPPAVVQFAHTELSQRMIRQAARLRVHHKSSMFRTHIALPVDHPLARLFVWSPEPARTPALDDCQAASQPTQTVPVAVMGLLGLVSNADDQFSAAQALNRPPTILATPKRRYLEEPTRELFGHLQRAMSPIYPAIGSGSPMTRQVLAELDRSPRIRFAPPLDPSLRSACLENLLGPTTQEDAESWGGDLYPDVEWLGTLTHPAWAGRIVSCMSETVIGSGPDQMNFLALMAKPTVFLSSQAYERYSPPGPNTPQNRPAFVLPFHLLHLGVPASVADSEIDVHDYTVDGWGVFTNRYSVSEPRSIAPGNVAAFFVDFRKGRYFHPVRATDGADNFELKAGIIGGIEDLTLEFGLGAPTY